MTAYAGQIANPQTHNDDVRKLIARARRESDSSTTTTEIGVLRIDGIAVKSGRHYRISASTNVNSSVSTDVITVRLRATTDGTTATTSSTQLEQATQVAARSCPIMAELTPGADQTVSLLLTVGRTSGTGNVKIEGNAIYPICVWVDDMGPDTGDVGVEL